jgi:carbonic anhydrase
MKRLLDGVVKFKDEFFDEHKEIFDEITEHQDPHTLYIGCSDSRVVPNLITTTLPGELFVIRNIGNMVPPYGATNEGFKCTASIIEYAVKKLEVDNIVVCGHSNCGGCKALYYPEEKLNTMPKVKDWLKLADEVKQRVLAKNLSKEEREFQTEQLNILKQIENLTTYPCVEERLKNAKLNILGWYYVIETGDVFQYNEEKREFELIEG